MSERPILWWYASGEQKFGPYSEAQLRGLVQAGHVRHGDLIWHHGLDGWVPAHSIEGLLPAHSPLPPALPPQLPAETSDEPDAQPDAFLATATPSDPWPSHADPAAAAAPAYRSSADPMTLFVGNNYAFYARRWAESERLGGVISWNWAAFFVSLPWLAYRKMYWHCGIIIAAGLLFMGTAQVLQIPPEKMMQWQINAAPIFSMLMGLFSNWIYRIHPASATQTKQPHQQPPWSPNNKNPPKTSTPSKKPATSSASPPDPSNASSRAASSANPNRSAASCSPAPTSNPSSNAPASQRPPTR